MRSLAFALLFALPLAGLAADGGPEGAIKALYLADQPFISGAGHGVIDSAKARAKFLSQTALRALAADEKAAARRGEPPTIEGDPFIDAQEADFSDLQIVKRSADAMSAVVEADFARPNAKTREKIDYALVFERGAWRIDDMTWIRAGQPPETLRKLLAAK